MKIETHEQRAARVAKEIQAYAFPMRDYDLICLLEREFRQAMWRPCGIETHRERAERIIDEWAGEELEFRAELVNRLAIGMADASNAELQRRRAVEMERDRLRMILDRADILDSAWFRDALVRKSQWSERTFGTGARTKGIIAHIRKELDEIAQDPTDLMEYVDVVNLALDGFWRVWMAKQEVKPETHELAHYLAACDFIHLFMEKMRINEMREWPKPTSDDEPVEHVRGADEPR